MGYRGAWHLYIAVIESGALSGKREIKLAINRLHAVLGLLCINSIMLRVSEDGLLVCHSICLVCTLNKFSRSR